VLVGYAVVDLYKDRASALVTEDYKVKSGYRVTKGADARVEEVCLHDLSSSLPFIIFCSCWEDGNGWKSQSCERSRV